MCQYFLPNPIHPLFIFPGTEILADANGGALASAAEEKPNEEFGVSGV